MRCLTGTARRFVLCRFPFWQLSVLRTKLLCRPSEWPSLIILDGCDIFLGCSVVSGIFRSFLHELLSMSDKLQIILTSRHLITGGGIVPGFREQPYALEPLSGIDSATLLLSLISRMNDGGKKEYRKKMYKALGINEQSMHSFKERCLHLSEHQLIQDAHGIPRNIVNLVLDLHKSIHID